MFNVDGLWGTPLAFRRVQPPGRCLQHPINRRIPHPLADFRCRRCPIVRNLKLRLPCLIQIHALANHALGKANKSVFTIGSTANGKMEFIKLFMVLVRNTEKELLHLGASLGIKIIHLGIRQRLHHGCPGISVGRLPPCGKWLNLRAFHDPVSIVNRWFGPGAFTIISHDCGTHQVAAVNLELFCNQLPRGFLLSRQAPQVIENQPGFLGGEAPIPLTAADP